MTTTRRRFLCSAGLGLVGTVTAAESATAAEHTISGRVQKPDNRPAANHRIDVVRQDVENVRVTTNPGGRFEANVGGSEWLILGYYESDGDTTSASSIKNGSPDIYPLARVQVAEDDLNLKNIQLPDAHRLDIVVRDANGESITDVRVRVITWRSWDTGRSGWGSGRRQVNENGQFQYRDAAEPGIELTGTVTAQVWPAEFDRDESPLAEREFELTSDRTEEFVLDEW